MAYVAKVILKKIHYCAPLNILVINNIILVNACSICIKYLIQRPHEFLSITMVITQAVFSYVNKIDTTMY